MSSSTPKTAFWNGTRDAAPMLVVIGPFAIVFAVLATEQGLSFAQTIGFSLLVIAGSAQFAALQLMIEDAHVALVVTAALAVNLRMAMYSASLAPHLGALPVGQRMGVAYMNVDQTFALSVARYEARPEEPLAVKFAYFWGTAAPIFVVWAGSSVAGALAGGLIPPELSLEFTVPITFFALISMMLRTAAHWCAAVVSVVVALVLYDMPYSLGLLLAGAAAMVTGAVAETAMGRRA
ncbi:AzlC family ABC transporter permease [Ovoidimarina sediminis]|uniref:AzlC family ABC transporter permease n=1 Tax=Ovoidimarina sediminis TaxID=3079856 RepID=UPI002907A254|nr:AzlC family ABC transporter permease [Rhodophyticola sp. MJ-SS7]MDU8943515.1 AzlC family ABC transporter permease [Rhodophyticola sp. MJ-SS7]